MEKGICKDSIPEAFILLREREGRETGLEVGVREIVVIDKRMGMVILIFLCYFLDQII